MFALLDLARKGLLPDTEDPKIFMRDALIEFGTTTAFVHLGTLMAVMAGAVLSASIQGVDVARLMPIAFVFGITITCLVYSTGHLSGGHMNPGVSLLMLLKRQISLKKMIAYWLVQFVGALVGAALTWGCVSGAVDELGGAKPPLLLGATTMGPALNSGNGFLLEFMGSTFFYFVIAQTALDKRSIASTPFPPLVIGFSLVVVHLCLITGTGCGVNPARTLGPAMINCMVSSDACEDAVGDWWWIYWIGPFAGSFFAAELSYLVTVGESFDLEVEQEPTTEAGQESPMMAEKPTNEEEVEVEAGDEQADS